MVKISKYISLIFSIPLMLWCSLAIIFADFLTYEISINSLIHAGISFIITILIFSVTFKDYGKAMIIFKIINSIVSVGLLAFSIYILIFEFKLLMSGRHPSRIVLDILFVVVSLVFATLPVLSSVISLKKHKTKNLESGSMS